MSTKTTVTIDEIFEMVKEDSDLQIIEFFYGLQKKKAISIQPEDGIQRRLPKITEHELRQSKHRGVITFAKRLKLVTTPRDKYDFTTQFEIFKHNYDSLTKYYQMTFDLYNFADEQVHDDDWFVDFHPADRYGFEDQAAFIADLSECQKLFRYQLIVQIVQILEVYWDDILKLMYNKSLESLIEDDKAKNKSLRYQEILKFEDLKDLRDYIVDDLVSAHKRWFQRKDIFKKLKINIDDSGFTSGELVKLIEQRNLIIHRKGIVDQQYLKVIKDDSKLGSELKITYELIGQNMAKVYELAKFIDDNVLNIYY